MPEDAPGRAVSRRVLLGAAGSLAAAATTTAAATATAGMAPAMAGSPGMAAARAALRRLLPDHAGQFRLRPSARGPERFRVGGRPGRIEVAGSGPAAVLTGVHWYLKYACGVHLSWAGGEAKLPDTLPDPRESRTALDREATVAHRFFGNDTHDGYTAPYARWPRWERLIDVLALHGFNEVLVTVGQEAVYHRMLQEFGYTEAEARSWLPAPSHQPWWLLQNMSGYGGPVAPELIAERVEMGRRITGRLRELGMAPVLPGFFGTVPDGFAARNPGARTVPQGMWAGLRRPDWLDPRSAAFRAAAASFYRHQAELFGPADLFKMDLLHEGGSAGDVPVAAAGRAVQAALRAARPRAVWVMLGWQANPRRALLDALDRRRVLVVDGRSDLPGTTDRERDWGGTPYAFGTIPNFGGRTTLGAAAQRWAERFAAWRDKPGSALVGTAYLPEAGERDPAALELFSELAWRRAPVDRAAWFDGYADLRYGAPDAAARSAFAVLRETAYGITSPDGRPHDSVFAARPSLAAASGTHYATHAPAYDLAAFDGAFAALLGVREGLRDCDAYRHDLTDLTRQVLANRSWVLIGRLRAAYERGDGDGFGALSRLWLRLLTLAEEASACHRAFLLGPWLAEARRAGLERTARVLLTTWADRPTADGGRLAGYANRDWSGLLGDVYLPRWRAYLDELADAAAAGRAPRTFDWYAGEEAWTRSARRYPVRPSGDPYRTARRVYEVLARAPYQGEVTVRAASGALTAVFRNTSGLRATGPVRLTVLAPAVAGEPAALLPPAAPGGTATARWPLADRSAGPVRWEVRAGFAPRGERPVTAVYAGG
ncbi:alpha-N-acetylglucosaminidase [Streptomyces solincola]|uniref:Alpha-N-acetylglucosaminidase n=1 Tax=Streptomyces solincola TaxID=2100817 RepID=A0A2S9PWQ8_9ACTN|nr:alpha-N-acetylglucosaminidase [Streptomyces solincola]